MRIELDLGRLADEARWARLLPDVDARQATRALVCGAVRDEADVVRAVAAVASETMWDEIDEYQARVEQSEMAADDARRAMKRMRRAVQDVLVELRQLAGDLHAGGLDADEQRDRARFLDELIDRLTDATAGVPG